MPSSVVSRYWSRKDQFDLPQRVRLVEDDLDANDATIQAIKEGMEALTETVRSQLNKILWAIVSLAFSFGAAAIAFAYSRGR